MAIRHKVTECKARSGFIWIVGEQDKKSTGDGGLCPREDDHLCDKACAQLLLDHKPIVCAKTVDVVEGGDDVPHVHTEACPKGLSVREKIAKWFADEEAKVADPEAEMPTKTVREKDDKGKLVDKQVPDRDLS